MINYGFLVNKTLNKMKDGKLMWLKFSNGICLFIVFPSFSKTMVLIKNMILFNIPWIKKH